MNFDHFQVHWKVRNKLLNTEGFSCEDAIHVLWFLKGEYDNIGTFVMFQLILEDKIFYQDLEECWIRFLHRLGTINEASWVRFKDKVSGLLGNNSGGNQQLLDEISSEFLISNDS